MFSGCGARLAAGGDDARRDDASSAFLRGERSLDRSYPKFFAPTKQDDAGAIASRETTFSGTTRARAPPRRRRGSAAR
tara:strand:+ start:679 stop:912 length:234 start_codon:yes stop_codon:yes gene_type:complete